MASVSVALGHEATQSREMGVSCLQTARTARRRASTLSPSSEIVHTGCTIKAHQFAEAFDSFAAAIELSIGQDKDLGVRLLEDIRDLFDLRPGIDRLTSAAMVDCLLELRTGSVGVARAAGQPRICRKLYGTDPGL